MEKRRGGKTSVRSPSFGMGELTYCRGKDSWRRGGKKDGHVVQERAGGRTFQFLNAQIGHYSLNVLKTLRLLML